MSVNLPQGLTGPIPLANTPSSPSSGGSIQNNAPLDILEASSGNVTILKADPRKPQLMPDQIPIAVYANIIMKNGNDAKRRLFNNDEVDNLSQRGLNLSLVQTAFAMIVLQMQYQTLITQQHDIFNQEQTNTTIVQNQIDNMNSQIPGINTSINTMNQATNTLNNSTSGTAAQDQSVRNAYNSAVDQWNSSAQIYNTLIATYNAAAQTFNNGTQLTRSEIDALNAQIDEINATRPAGSSPIPHVTKQDPVNLLQPLPILSHYSGPIPPSPPLSTIPLMNSIPNINTLTPPPSQSDFMNTYFQPIYDAELAAYKVLQGSMKIFRDVVNYEQFIKRFKNSPIIPDSYYSPKQAAGAGGSGGNVGANVIAGSVNPAIVGRAFNNSLLQQALQRQGIQSLTSVGPSEGQPLSPKLFDQLHQIGLNLLSGNGLLAALPAVGFLAEKLATLDANSPVIGAALSLAYVKNITNIVSDPIVQSQISSQMTQLLGNVPNADELSKELTASLNISLLTYALNQASIELGIPGLGPQVLAITAGVSPENAAIAFGGTRLNSVIENPLSLTAIQNSLVGAGATPEQSQNAVNALTGLGINPTEADVRNAVSPYLPPDLVGIVIEAIRAQREKEDSQSQQIVSESINQSYLQASLNQALQQQSNANSEAISNQVMQQLLLKQTYNNEADFRSAMKDLLIQSEISPDNAYAVANAAVVSSSGNPLQFPGINQGLSAGELATYLNAHIVNNLQEETGAAFAHKLADKSVDALIGTEVANPHSLLNLLSDNLAIVRKEKDTESDKKIVESFFASIRPTVDYFTIYQKVSDPANNILFSAQTGLSYSSHNFGLSKDPLSIQV